MRSMKIFIGSPFKGLEDVRRGLRDALEPDYEVLWMEDFGSHEADSLRVCLDYVEEADAYVLIFGSLYGTLLPDSDYSYTQLEYEHAQRTGTPVLAYVQKLGEGEERDPASTDFLRQVQSSHQVEFKEFESASELVAFVERDLPRLRARLARPKFRSSAPVADEEAYAIGTLRKNVLRGAPFTVSVVDAGALGDKKYRPEKRGRLGEKVKSIERVTSELGTVQVFNDFPIKQKGDLVKLRAKSVNKNARLIVLLIGKEGAVGARDLFEEAQGELAVFYGDWITIDGDDQYVETFSDDDLNSCALRTAVLELIESRVDSHVVAETS
jgi:hypothetical protein